jgi:hypothetical protein
MSGEIETFDARMQRWIIQCSQLRLRFEYQVHEAKMRSAVNFHATYIDWIWLRKNMLRALCDVEAELIDDSNNFVEIASEETIHLYRKECVAQQNRLTVRVERANQGYQDLVRKATEAREMHEKLGTAQSRAAMIASQEAARRAIMCDIFTPVRFASKQTIELYRAEIAACRV